MAFGAIIKLTPDTSSSAAKTLRSNIQACVNTAVSKDPIKIRNVKLEVKDAKKLFADLQASLDSKDGVTLKIRDIDASKAIANLRKQLETMLSGLSITGLKEFLGAEGVENTYIKAEAAAKKLADAQENVRQKSAAASAAMKELGNIQSILNTSYKNISKSGDQKSADVSESISEYRRLNDLVAKYRGDVNALNAQEIEDLRKDSVTLKQNTAALLEKEAAAKKAAAENSKASKVDIASDNAVIALKTRIQKLIIANGKAYKVYGSQIDSILDELNSGKPISTQRLQDLNSQVKEFEVTFRKAGASGNTFFETFKKGIAKFGGWSLVTRTLMAGYRQIKNVVSAVKELDTAMTELRKVTDLTESAYSDFVNTAASLSQKIGSSLTDTVNATADFARLGYNLHDATSLAEAALVYKNVGDGIEDIGEASESLISTIKAFEQFGISANNSMLIIDKFNEVGNNFAISSEGIGTALQKSASALAAANNDLDQSVALVTAMNSVLQNPEQVGTALKTLTMYLRAAKTEAEEAGEETEGMANSVSELRSELLKLTKNKVDIMVDDTTFKSTYEIIRELAGVWDELSDVDTANILELIGGKRNATAVTSLITNFKDAESALVTAQQAAGSATAENEKYLDSINGKLDVLQAKYQTIANNLLDSSFVKLILDIASALADVLEVLSKIPVVITLIIAGVDSIIGHKTSKNIKQLTTNILLQKTALLDEEKVSDGLATSISSLTDRQKRLLIIKLQQKVANKEISQTEYEQIIATLNLQKAEETLVAEDGSLIAANHGLAASFKSLMASVPIVGWISLVITLITEVVQWITSWASSSESAREQAIEDANAIIDAYSEAKKTFNSNTDSLTGMRDEFESLSKGVNENGENVSLTASQYEEYLKLVDEIVEISPDVVKGYDKEGKAIVNYTTLLQDAIDAQNIYLANQRNIYLGSGEDLFSGKAEEYKDLSKELGKAAGDLSDSLNDGFFYSFFHWDEADAKTNAWRDAVRKIGISFDAKEANERGIPWFDTWKSSTEAVMRMYENADEFMVLLRNSGEYTNDELDEIEDKLRGLAGPYTSLANIQKAQVDYLAEWSKEQKWYSEIPSDALDEFYGLLEKVNAPLKDYNENLEYAANAGEEFSEQLGTNRAKNLFSLVDKLREGSISVKEYNDSVKKFRDENKDIVDSDVNEALVSYFNSLSDNIIAKAGVYKKTLSDLSDAIEQVQNGYKILSQAQSDMAENGALSADTIKSIRDAMADGESYLDYLDIENGKIQLNIHAWRERANATLDGDISEIKKETASLQSQNDELRKKIALEQEIIKSDDIQSLVLKIPARKSLDEYSNQIAENNKKIAENQKLLELYSGIYKDLSNETENIIDPLEALGGIQDILGIIDKAKADIKDSGSVTIDTIKSMKQLLGEEENYLDYLTIENGQVKLNTAAWKERELAKLNTSADGIQTDIDRLKAENEELQKYISSLPKGNDEMGVAEASSWWELYGNRIADATKNLKENNEEIRELDGLLDIFKEKILELTEINVLDFSEMVTDLGDIEGSVKSLVSAMSDLASGTSLTQQELAKLALEYPKLLEASDLFTNGSISGQKNILNAVLDSYEKEYDATIDTKIAELEASNKILESQIELEKNKEKVLSEIQLAAIEGRIADQKFLQDKLNTFNDLQKQNFVTMSEGILKVNEEALNQQKEATSETTQNITDLWSDSASAITRFHGIAAQGIVGQIGNVGAAIASSINDVFNGGMWGRNGNGENKIDFQALINNVAASVKNQIDKIKNELNLTDTTELQDISDSYGQITIDGLDIQEWIETKRQETQSRFEQVQNQIETNKTIIENLRRLKGLDLTTLYGSSGSGSKSSSSSSKSKEIDEYFADVDEYYAAIKRLEEAQLAKEKLENRLSHTDDPSVKIDLENQLIRAYKQEADAEASLMTLKQKSIAANVEALKKLGFEVEYNSSTNRLFIKNLEHINELTASSAGEYETLLEATNALRKETEELIDVTEELNDDNVESAQNIEDLTYDILEAKKSVVDYIEEIYEKQIDAYKEIIELRKEALQAAKEESDYESDVADKVKEIAELQARIDQLSLDDSRSAQAERNSLLEELAERNKDLADYQGDHAYDAQMDALDKLGENYEKEKNDEIEILRSSIDASEDLWDAFYQTILGKNVSIGDSINKEIVNAWIDAAQAVRDYSSAVSGVSISSAYTYVPKYHSGGVVGISNSDKHEVLALLQSGEVVLNQAKQDSLYEIIDFQSELSKRLNSAIGQIHPNMISGSNVAYPNAIGAALSNPVSASSAVTYENVFHIQVGHADGMTDMDAKRFGEQIATSAIDKLNSAFERKGISRGIGSKLMP